MLSSCLPIPSAEDTLLALDNIENYLTKVSSSPLFTRNIIVEEEGKESKILLSYDPSNFYFHMRKESSNIIENELWVYVDEMNVYYLIDVVGEKTGAVEYLEDVSSAQAKFMAYMDSLDETYKQSWVDASKLALTEARSIVNNIIDFENDNNSDYEALEELSYSTSFDEHGNFSLKYKEMNDGVSDEINIVFNEYYLREYSLIIQDEEDNYYEMSEIFTLGVPLEYPDVKEFIIEEPITVSKANALLDAMEAYLNGMTSRPAYTNYIFVKLGEDITTQNQKIDLDNYYFYEERTGLDSSLTYAYVEGKNFVQIKDNTYTLTECASVEDARALFDTYILELESVTQGKTSYNLNTLTLMTIASMRNLLESASSLTSRGEGYLNLIYEDTSNDLVMHIELENNYLAYVHQTMIVNDSNYVNESIIEVGAFDLIYPDLSAYEKVSEL